MKDKICGKYRGVTGHRTSATDSPSKCAEKVLAECANKEFFTWRQSNNACHCVEEPNCNSPGTNVGLDIYRADSCGGIVFFNFFEIVLLLDLTGISKRCPK